MPKLKAQLSDRAAALDEHAKEAFCGYLKQAAYHLAECWDMLRDAEQLLGDDAEIETDDIEVLTAETSDPADAFKFTDATVLEYLGVRILGGQMNDLPARTPFQDAMDAIYNPDWKPLERAVQLAGLPLMTCGDFMFMHQDTRGVCHYKHIDTRNYASLRIDSTPEVCVAELAKARSMERTWGKTLDARLAR